MAKHFQVDTGGTLTTSLVSYFKLEDATDYYGSNGLSNTDGVTFGTAKVNNGATNFDGSSSRYLNITSASGLPSGSGAWSVSGWVYPNSLSHNGCAISFGATGSTTGSKAMMYQVNGNLYFSGYSADIDSGKALANTSWNMITVTYDGTTVRTYVNGVAGNTATLSLNILGSNIVIGTINDLNTSEDWKGGVDEVGIWSKVLSSTEISDLYNGGAGQTMVPSSAFTRTQSDSIMNAASRTATVGRVLDASRALYVTMMNAASRLATVGRGFSINISDSIMNAASRLSAVTNVFGRVRALSDSIMNAASRSTTIAKIQGYVRALSDSIMNASSRLATVATVRSLVRNLSVSMMNAAGRFTTFLVKSPLWWFRSKNNATWSMITKHAATWGFRSKNNATWTFENKSNTSGTQDTPSK